MGAAAKVKECAGRFELWGECLDLLQPTRERVLNKLGNLAQLAPVGLGRLLRHAAPKPRQVESERVQHSQLGRETFCRWDGTLNSSEGRQRSTGLQRHAGVGI